MKVKGESFWKFVVACLRTGNKELAKKVVEQNKKRVMADEIQKIREELARLKEETSIGLSEYDAGVENGRMEIINALSIFLDSMQKEYASGDVEEAAKHYLYSNILYDDVYVGNPTEKDCIEMFRAGANWQKEQMMAKAVNAGASYTMSVPSICISLPLGVNVGDKVKVIVIKED